MGKWGLEEGSWHRSPVAMASGGCAERSQARLLQLLAPAPHTWSLAGAVPGLSTAHFTCLALPGSLVGVQGQGGPLWGISGNRKFSFSAWQASLVLLLESKPSCLLGKWKNQTVEFNLELYILVMELVNFKKRHLFCMGLRYVGLIHNLSVCEQGCETTLKADHCYFYHIPPLPWNSISFSSATTFFFSFCHMTWKIHYSTKYNLSQIRVTSVQKSNLGFYASSPVSDHLWYSSFHTYDLLCSAAWNMIIWAEQKCKLGQFLQPDFKLLFCASNTKE